MRTRVVTTHTLGTLGAGAASIENTRVDANRLNGCTIRKARMGISMRGKTTDQGPLMIGMSAGLTAAQIGEWFVADPQHRKDEQALEESQRKVMVVAHMDKETTNLVNLDFLGRLRSFKFPWEIIEGEVLNTMVLNADSAGLTTGTIIDIWTELLGDWLDD